MKIWPFVFVAMTILAWGAYVPMIHHGQSAIGGRSKGLWAFLFVGLAYFLVAVLVPLGLLIARKDIGALNTQGHGVSISIFAGVLGAIGALGVILALMYGAKPIMVAPIVFAGAPIVNTFVSMMWDKPSNPPSRLFYLGIVLAAVGAALVLSNNPAAPAKPIPPANVQP